MIEKHIVNIGYPRTATTWLWECAKFSPGRDKENNILTTRLDFKQYIDYYSQFTISANFNPNLWCVDREIIKFIQQHATHISLIVRSPYDFIERFFDWIHHDQDIDTLTEFLVTSGYIRYKDIVNRWYTNTTNFKIFFFEDFEKDPKTFFEDYMAFCQIPIVKNDSLNYNKKVNANPKQEKIKLNFTDRQVSMINHEIDQFQPIAGRDLTHWKK